MTLPHLRKLDRAAAKKRPTFLFPRSVHAILASLCLLVFLVLAWLAVWLGVPAWYTRLTGTEAAGTAKVAGFCGADDFSTQGDNAETYQYAFQITNTQGQTMWLTSDLDCNNLYENGEHVTLWYLPNDLNSFVTSTEALWLYTLTPIWAAIALVALRFFWVLVKPFLTLLRAR